MVLSIRCFIPILLVLIPHWNFLLSSIFEFALFDTVEWLVQESKSARGRGSFLGILVGDDGDI